MNISGPMGETFYTVLGVTPDADRETIRTAYRERVKESHPDVNDTPGAAEAFKRLTTTRDVLLDPEKRKQYDALGHDTYVRRHLNDSAWSESVPDEPVTRKRARSTGSGSTGVTDATGDGTQQTHQGDRGRRTATASERYHSQVNNQREHSRHYSSGGVAASWQRASDVYRRTETFETNGGRSLRDTGVLVRRLTPWVFIHTVLIASTVATVWFTYSSATTQTAARFSVLVTTLILLCVVVTVSVSHILSLLYS